MAAVITRFLLGVWEHSEGLAHFFKLLFFFLLYLGTRAAVPIWDGEKEGRSLIIKQAKQNKNNHKNYINYIITASHKQVNMLLYFEVSAYIAFYLDGA